MIRVLTAAVLVAALVGAPASPAGAHVGGTCWGEWPDDRDCHFLLRGVPIEVWGHVTGDGPVRIHMQVEIYLEVIRFAEPTLVFLECEGSGEGEASCEAELGPEQILNIPFGDNVHALCIPDGVGAGDFGCRAGTGT